MAPRPRPLIKNQMCCFCRKHFTCNGLISHYEKKHPNNKIPCRLCFNLFEFQIDPEDHILAVHGEDLAATGAAPAAAAAAEPK